MRRKNIRNYKLREVEDFRNLLTGELEFLEGDIRGEPFSNVITYFHRDKPYRKIWVEYYRETGFTLELDDLELHKNDVYNTLVGIRQDLNAESALQIIKWWMEFEELQTFIDQLKSEGIIHTVFDHEQ